MVTALGCLLAATLAFPTHAVAQSAAEEAPAELGPPPETDGTNPGVLPPHGSWSTTDLANSITAVSINNFNRSSVLGAYRGYVAAVESTRPGWTGSVSGCNAGAISQSYVDGAESIVNFFREFAGNLLPAEVSFDTDAQNAALIMHANNASSHYPSSDWRCWSESGALGASTSNLYLGQTDLRAIAGYMFDPGALNGPVGHRRWILAPRVTTMGVGATSNANILRVVGLSREVPRVEVSPAVITWPPPGYLPEELTPERWSVSIPTGALLASTIDWSSASVQVSINGSVRSAGIEHSDNGVYGGLATLVFTLPLNLTRDRNGDRVVDVTVSDLLVSNQGRVESVDYSWTTTIIDSSSRSTGSDPEVEPEFGRLPAVKQCGGWAATHTASGPIPGVNPYPGQPVVIAGSEGADEIAGSESDEIICGHGGDDSIVGGGGSDLILAGSGNDTVHGSGGDDLIFGGFGDDTVLGGEGDDRIRGEAGKDRVRGQNGDDRIDGGPDNDNLNGNNGDDQVNGGNGHDYVSGRDGFDIVTGGNGTDTVNGGGKRDIIRGGQGNDTINGNGWGDMIYGGQGHDTISGGDGPDTIYGESGNDMIDGNRGNDTLSGGPGHDECRGRTGWDSATGCESSIEIP